MNILVSACLLGLPCRYDGEGKASEAVCRLSAEHTLIPVCPEQLGGLPTPRPPSEIVESMVKTCGGQDVTEQFERGAKLACCIAGMCRCTHAVLKQRSPSCGSSWVYDGSFSGTLRTGEGKTAALLRQSGIVVLDEESVQGLQNDVCR